MKARYQYRIYPTDRQRKLLAQVFGCVRVVFNDALALCKAAHSRNRANAQSDASRVCLHSQAVSSYDDWDASRPRQKLPKNSELQKICITQAKKTEERQWLSEVSNIPLQQSVADLGVAYKNFFDSCNGKRKGRRVGYPRFKKKHNQQTARFRKGGFSIQGVRADRPSFGRLAKRKLWCDSFF